MRLDLIAQMLERSGIGALGQDIFISMMPASIKTGVLLREPYGGTPINHEMPGYFKGSFTLVCRSPDYEEGARLINDAIAAMKVDSPKVDGAVQWNWIRPMTKPVSFPLSEGSLIEFTARISFCVVELGESARRP